jgi:hypothetical protein
MEEKYGEDLLLWDTVKIWGFILQVLESKSYKKELMLEKKAANESSRGYQPFRTVFVTI